MKFASCSKRRKISCQLIAGREERTSENDFQDKSANKGALIGWKTWTPSRRVAQRAAHWIRFCCSAKWLWHRDKMSWSHGRICSPVFNAVLVSPQPDRTYDLKIGQPTVSYFLKQAAGIAKGAGKTGEKLCCSVASALTPLFTHWAHPVKDTRPSLGSV